MSEQTLGRVLGYFALVVLVLCVVLHFRLSVSEGHGQTIASVWRKGVLVERVLLASPHEPSDVILSASSQEDTRIVHEVITGEGPLPFSNDLLLAMALASGADGLRAVFGQRTTFITVDDLLLHRAYDAAVNVPSIGFSFGTDPAVLWALLAERFGESIDRIRRDVTLTRLRLARVYPQGTPARRVTADTLSQKLAANAVHSAASYLARNLESDGRFRYLVDPLTNTAQQTGYELARHSGAVYFLAEAESKQHDPNIAAAALRGAAYVRDHASARCGENACIGTDDVVDIGQSALFLLALTELMGQDGASGYVPLATELATFLRRQQREDGEFRHRYDRTRSLAIDSQLPYFTGEAALALARFGKKTGHDVSTRAAVRAVSYLTGPAWNFFGSRYFMGEEHWTCQALEATWSTSANLRALEFCLRFHDLGRGLQYDDGEALTDSDGAYGFGHFTSPRFTPTASRAESALATLAVARRANMPRAVISSLDLESKRALAALVRNQMSPGPYHLFFRPEAAEGAFPASAVDLHVRIDYVQHAGSALARFLK